MVFVVAYSIKWAFNLFNILIFMRHLCLFSRLFIKSRKIKDILRKALWGWCVHSRSDLCVFLSQTYSKTVSMVPYKHPQHLKETSRALNVLYVFDRSYESFLVYWLFPLQIAFRIKDQYSDDKGVSIFICTHVLWNCVFLWVHVSKQKLWLLDRERICWGKRFGI